MKPELVVTLIFFAVMIGIGVVGVLSARRKRRRTQRWAASHGWTYVREEDSLPYRFSSFPFRRGRSRSARHVLTSDWNGVPVTSFHYQYATGNNDNRTTHVYHVMAIALPVPLPPLRLQPEGADDALGKFFGGQDIEFESAAFNERWRVQGPEGRYPYDFLHPRMMERLLAPDAVGPSITVDRSNIVAWYAGPPELDRIVPTMSLLADLVALVPRFVWQDAGHQQR